MKKLLVLSLITLLLVGLMAGVVGATEDTHIEGKSDRSDHKISSKWDMEGNFHSTRGITGEWYYDIHIKEAVDGQYSVGSLYFSRGEKEIIGKVEVAYSNYQVGYWAGLQTNLFAAGTALYEGEEYFFMFLYHNDKMWVALSDLDYSDYIEDSSIWNGTDRVFELHSLEGDSYEGQFEHYPKVIR